MHTHTHSHTLVQAQTTTRTCGSTHSHPHNNRHPPTPPTRRQLLANYRNGNAESLSVLFLFQWLAGDALNLIGAKMTHQLATQIITAYYFVCVDIVLIMQFTYYTVKSTLQDNAESKGEYSMAVWVCEGGRKCGCGCTTRMYQASGSVLLLVSSVAVTAKSWMNEPDFADTTSRGTGRTLQAVHADNGSGMTTNEIGYMLGIASAAFYLSSRIPQIIKNIKRRSTGGLAFTMFLLAVVGNVTYSLGILITSTEKNFILQKLPWIVGRSSVLAEATIE
ncbi:hypothetical protein SARC_02310 [Sphaeroforma arctica JP610]|uniref:Uncharacterized protein n=1 Tax=Sphaeroforma arctica JP610 TaxID=667725 RepID=A0A0L0G9B6_9EUKA|nr:hypothetical protein SARC_02310 [Sphaeroforma arctica JP610]KNC85509.1 hypothetical protein SARC_02310 [Sphaeroforma arctica JP610]|eukprot:XP_014159411.1 hypothetical protein SARC_02310 [Sphaeroforma arctica JP610]